MRASGCGLVQGGLMVARVPRRWPCAQVDGWCMWGRRVHWERAVTGAHEDLRSGGGNVAIYSAVQSTEGHNGLIGSWRTCR